MIVHAYMFSINIGFGLYFSCSQLDNNNFGGNSIPDTYANMTKLVKL
jgi:hypothetical protein